MCLEGLHRGSKVRLEHQGRKKSEREATGNALQGLENNAGLKGKKVRECQGMICSKGTRNRLTLIAGVVHSAALKSIWLYFPTEKAAKGLKGKANFHSLNQI